jgi:hypothetical protein
MTDNSSERIEQALDLARRGMAYDACERLWPLVRDPGTRDEAVFTLAYCFERANNLPTAAYLYSWVANHHPEFNVAARRLETCRATLDARGLHEDFSDSGHVDCACGLFRYRAELGLCPYCGKTPGEGESPGATVSPDASDQTAQTATPPSEEALANIRHELDRAWKSIQQRFDEFQQRDDLTGPAHHAQILARELSDRAKKLADTETGQSLKRAADQARAKTTEQLRAAGERDDVQEARTRLEDWTHNAAERIEEFTRSERVQSAGRTAYETAQRFVARLQRAIDRATGRTGPEVNEPTEPPVDDPERRETPD